MPKAVVSTTGQQVQYCLTLVDRASQWVEIILVGDTTAKTSALAIHEHWITRYGFPSELHSDLGSAFTSDLYRELCALYGINHTFASSQNHKSVSRAEGVHRIMLSALRKMCTSQKQWPDKLPSLLLALRSTVNTAIGISPAFMLFHREIRIPMLAHLPVSTNVKDATLEDIAERTSEIDKFIQESSEASFARADVHYNKRVITPHFKVGDRVLLYDEHVSTGSRKLHRFYREVIIVECLPHYCYRIRDVETDKLLPFKIHASRLKSLGPPSGLNGNEQIATSSDSTTPTPQLSTNTSDSQTSTLTDNRHSQTDDHAPSYQTWDYTFGRTNKTRQSNTTPSTTDKCIPQTDTSLLSTNNTWLPIKQILSRRRKSDGTWLYQVEFQSGEKLWLPARDIDPATVRQYISRQRRRQ